MNTTTLSATIIMLAAIIYATPTASADHCTDDPLLLAYCAAGTAMCTVNPQDCEVGVMGCRVGYYGHDSGYDPFYARDCPPIVPDEVPDTHVHPDGAIWLDGDTLDRIRRRFQ